MCRLVDTSSAEGFGMPRFYFHTDDGPDLEGQELESIVVAKCEAIRTFGKIVCDDAETFWDRAEWTMMVTDDRGLSLFQIHIVGTDAPATGGGQKTARPN